MKRLILALVIGAACASGAVAGTLLLMGAGPGTTGGAPPASNNVLFVDGASYLLLVDGSSNLCLAGGC